MNVRKYSPEGKRIICKLFGPIISNKIFALLLLLVQVNYGRNYNPATTKMDGERHNTSTYKYNKAIIPLLNPRIMKEKIKNIEENKKSSKKTFYHIGRYNDIGGLFAWIIYCMQHVSYAVAKGYIPVIDMQNFDNPYLDPQLKGKENPWEYYFEQPCGFGLDNLHGSQCIDSALNSHPILPFFRDYDYKPVFNFWNEIFSNYLKLNKVTQEYVDKEYEKIIKKDMKVLGVYCRGTDYSALRPTGHAVQPEISDVIEKCKSSMKEWGCGYIYVTADEKKIVDQFETAFPGKVLSISRLYYDSYNPDEIPDKLVTRVKFDRENDYYLRGLEYLASIVILSKCDCMIAGIAGGSEAAIYMNGGKYEHRYLFDLGYYGINEKTLKPD